MQPSYSWYFHLSVERTFPTYALCLCFSFGPLNIPEGSLRTFQNFLLQNTYVPPPHFCLVYASDNQRTVVRSLALATGLCVLQNVPYSCWGPPSHLFDRNRRLFLGEGVKRPEREAEHSALFKVKKKLNCTSVPPCTFLACRGTV